MPRLITTENESWEVDLLINLSQDGDCQNGELRIVCFFIVNFLPLVVRGCNGLGGSLAEF